MKFFLLTGLAGLIALAAHAETLPVPAAGEIGVKLDQSFIWTRESSPTNQSLQVGFRRSVVLPVAPVAARLHLFAYTRYQLFVNGDYVGRGPNRFENRRPEYDTWDIAARLHAGTNVLAVLVHRDWPGENAKSTGMTLSRIRRHAPGFTARLELQATGPATVIPTDESWHAFAETGYGQPVQHSYSSIPDNFNAPSSPGDWTAVDFDDRNLPLAERLDTSNREVWPVLSPRTIPLLREKAVEFSIQPATGESSLTNGNEWKLTCSRIVQA